MAYMTHVSPIIMDLVSHLDFSNHWIGCKLKVDWITTISPLAPPSPYSRLLKVKISYRISVVHNVNQKWLCWEQSGVSVILWSICVILLMLYVRFFWSLYINCYFHIILLLGIQQRNSLKLLLSPRKERVMRDDQKEENWSRRWKMWRYMNKAVRIYLALKWNHKASYILMI